MISTRLRFVCVALLVCVFAVGMATFLNYFKYKATAAQIIKSRVLVVTNAIEDGVQASLALGLAFGEMGMVGGLLERQAASDSLIVGIDVFDTAGKQIYSTDAVRIGRNVPDAWANAAGKVKDTLNSNVKDSWAVQEPEQLVAGTALKNNFNLTIGYLAVRYSRAYVDAAAERVGKRLVLTAIPLLLVIFLLSPLALTLVIKRFESDMRGMDAAFLGNAVEKTTKANRGVFTDAEILNSTLLEAELGLVQVRSQLLRKS
jgi:hypothetical protein